MIEVTFISVKKSYNEFFSGIFIHRNFMLLSRDRISNSCRVFMLSIIVLSVILLFISEIDDPVNDLLGFERYIGKTGFIVFVQKAVLYTKLFGNIIGIFTHPFHSFPYLLKQLYHVRARSFPKFSVTFIIFAPLSAENKTGWSQTHPV